MTLNLYFFFIFGHNKVQLGLELPPKLQLDSPISFLHIVSLYFIFWFLFLKKKLIFFVFGNNPELGYDSRHVLTRIDLVNSVLVGNDGFDLKLIFYPGRHGLTRIDSVNSVLSEMTVLTRNSFFTLVDMVWPGGLGFDGKMRLTREKIYFWILNFFLIFFGFL